MWLEESSPWFVMEEGFLEGVSDVHVGANQERL